MIPTILPATYINDLQYEGNVPTFPLHGTIDLVDCIECFSEEIDDEDSSEWELAIKYPLGGIGFDMLVLDNIILAKANDYQDPQAFRIYSVEKNIGKTVNVKAQHISYDMNNTPVKPFSVDNAADAMTHLRTDTIYGSDNWKQHHFYFSTDIQPSDPVTKFEFETPKSMRSVLLNGDDSIKGTYGGDLVFNNYEVQLLQMAGEDRGVTINYGVDLIDMTQEYNNCEMITGILPYYKEDKEIVYGDVTYGPGTYSIQKIEPVDMAQYFSSKPSVAELNAKAQEWVEKEKIGEPKIELTISYANLGKDVRLHDAIQIRFPAMGIDVKSKVVKYKYDVLLERCEEVDVGHAKESNYFNLMDASKLKKGLIPVDRVANSSIGGSKIAPSTINGGYHITPQSIPHGILNEKAIEKDNIADHAITHSMLQPKEEDMLFGKPVVWEEDIDDRAVTTKKIGVKAIKGGSVTNPDADNATNIAGGTITTGNTNSGINTNLGYGGDYHDATTGDHQASYFHVGYLVVTSGISFNSSVFTPKEATINGVTYHYLGW